MNKQEIHDICTEYNIKNYIINSDGYIDVDGSVYLYNMDLTEIPLKFNKVSGVFDCSDNLLTTLKGSPKEVGGDFNCSVNNLNSLEGSPKQVSHFYCDNNQLKTLKHSPNYVSNDFICISNELINLNGIGEIGRKIICSGNPLESLEGYNGEYDKLECDNKDGLILKMKRKNKIKLLENL